MFPVKHIDFRINREQFEAFTKWMLLKLRTVHSSLIDRESDVDTYDLLLHDHAINKISQTHLASWQYRPYDKLYNYKLPAGVAMVIHERLREEGYEGNWSLNKFHAQLYLSLARYFSDEKLNPKQLATGEQG